MVYKQLINYIEKYNILTECQFEFRTGHSTEQAITEITENFRKSFDNNQYTRRVFIDFAKAFDTVNHELLPRKLESHGIRGTPLKWFPSYLSKRQQYVLRKVFSPLCKQFFVESPTVSTLGPLLFLLD